MSTSKIPITSRKPGAFWAAVFLTTGLISHAHASTVFTYQGQLSDSGGAVTNTCDMTFDLYDAANNGNIVGTQDAKKGVSVINGLFTVQLDFGSSAFDGNDRWLEIAVKCGFDATFTTLGRQPINPTPYASFANSVPWSGIKNAPTFVTDTHDHDVRYYLKSEIDTKLGQKADTDHKHTDYPSQSEIDAQLTTQLATKADTNHAHTEYADASHIHNGSDTVGNLSLSGGSIDNSVIGATTPAAGTFTNLTVNDATPLVLEGATADDHETSLAVTD
ncbi:MAG: hypothetical protein DRR08_29545, partial [Candidatus Parabeggiatoa sp. nov. 2]